MDNAMEAISILFMRNSGQEKNMSRKNPPMLVALHSCPQQACNVRVCIACKSSAKCLYG